jgi:Zn-dependent M32 family carboxypeptidase
LLGRYAEIVLDICWALFEIRLHADPDQRPNDVWTELTSTYLGIAPHPEWSWWAMRGQLVQEPGYMVNYAIGPILAADLRATIRAEHGDWVRGDPSWYEWVSEHIYRWGLERSSGDVLRGVLGRPPDHHALLAELARIGSAANGSAP